MSRATRAFYYTHLSWWLYRHSWVRQMYNSSLDALDAFHLHDGSRMICPVMALSAAMNSALYKNMYSCQPERAPRVMDGNC